MKPLQSIAMGLVIIVIIPRIGGHDALPDPVGWLLILFGIRALPQHLVRREALAALGGLAAAVSVALWFPTVTDALYAADASLGWVANLPQIGFTALLCHVLAHEASQAGDARAARWLLVTRTLVIVVGLLPVVVFGAGMLDLEVTSYVAATASLLLLTWLLFTYASRPWANVAIGETAAKGLDTP